MRFLLAVTAATTLSVSAIAMTYPISGDSLISDIKVLASDSLEGREIGEPGEMKAARFIEAKFMQAGLQPKGTNGYLQPFEFIKKIEFGPKNHLTVNGKELQLNEDWVPLQNSASRSFSFDSVISVNYGIVTDDSSYNDYKGLNVEGKAVLIKRFSPDSASNPHVDFSKYSSLTDKILAATNRKAAAIFFVTPTDKDDTLPAMAGATHVATKDIPVVYLKRAALEKLGISIENPTLVKAQGETELIAVKDTGYNVIGYLGGKSDTIIVIGAHYDHLGWGAPGSRYLGKEKAVHHGADDNASGTAGLLELTQYFSSRKDQLQHSMLFCAFTGEEEGVLGSNYFVKHMTVDSSKIRMMLNMDMIGRLRDQENGLAVFGSGTAAEFKQYFDTLKRPGLKITFREPGTGPSDQTPFYNSGIPVLHFFTGAHEDYHKPSDTWDKIDTAGTARVVQLVADIATHFDALPQPLTFQRVKDPNEGKQRAAFTVSLGIMPDYVAQVKGVKVDGVMPDRPGEHAGIKKSDVIIKMGSLPIDDIYAYMSALGKFKKGDSTTIVVQRGADTLSLPVVFK